MDPSQTLESTLATSAAAYQQGEDLLAALQPANPAHSTEGAFALHKQFLASLSILRNLNRSALLSARQTKEQTARARQDVDRLHLQLQNLYYEQRHLLEEIAACESYDHSYRKLPLIPVEDFLAQFPEHAPAAGLGDVDDNNEALMVARIEHERAEREKLEQHRQALLKRKQKLIAENKKRKDDLANLDRDLEKFIDAAKPIQKLFERDV